MIDRIIEILEENQDKFMGINEANLHSAEEIAMLSFEFSEWFLTHCYFSGADEKGRTYRTFYQAGWKNTIEEMFEEFLKSRNK